MAKSQIFPACISYYNKVINTFKTANEAKLTCSFLYSESRELGELLTKMKKCMDKLETNIKEAKNIKNDCLASATCWKDFVLTAMNELREVVDLLETKVDEKEWPMPTYIDLLFGIQ